MGIRGMPLPNLSFGGFEAFIAGLAPRLVACGHEVTVYCRRDLYDERPHSTAGVRLRFIPSINQKVVGTPLHMLLCALDALWQQYDAILVLNSGNGVQCVVLRLGTNARLLLNMDGVEWERRKWGVLGRWYFKFASRVGVKVVHVPIADSRAIAELYRRDFGVRPTFIPYGVDLYDSAEASAIEALGLVPGQYALIVGRLIPENCTDTLIEGFQRALPGCRLVVVGGSNYRSGFHAKIAQIASPSTVFIGHIHNQATLWQLFKHSRVYIHGHSVGGTNPSLLQALAAGCVIAANDVVFNREVLGHAGTFFEPSAEGVGKAVSELWDLSSAEAALRRSRAQARIDEGGYSWERVTAAYEESLSAGLRGPAGRAHSA